jgi:hypothetical protein
MLNFELEESLCYEGLRVATKVDYGFLVIWKVVVSSER